MEEIFKINRDDLNNELSQEHPRHESTNLKEDDVQITNVNSEGENEEADQDQFARRRV